ncbi:MAG: LysM peptidoglycan-binding domain-containing protein [Gammaproteobacteria bacterium]|nr:LysM peptidoglycan-binding domain-containing protein [Gammaproteobacteria bacterium]
MDKPKESAKKDDTANYLSNKPKDDSYKVVRGDNLWKISGKKAVYDNPFQWPLIYKANRQQIKDADLIFPGQTLAIARGMSSSDIDAAVKHAKTRGAWSIGKVEASDTAYLNR